MDRNEAELVALAQGGDVDAYAELVRRYQHLARRVGAAIGGIDVAEEAAQDAFVRAFRALARFDARRAFRPWLLAIVANAARNHRRSAARWERAGTRSAERMTIVATESPEEEVLANEMRRRLEHALATLSPRHREVVACRYLMDLSEEETSESLGIPRGTVKSRLSRALAHMSEVMREEAAHDG